MMGQYQMKPSFAGGELTPALYGRMDLQKYDTGAALLKNAVVLRYGGVTRRSGFRHVAVTRGNGRARLIPFSYNAEQNYVLEFTAGKIRVFWNGALVSGAEVSAPYTAAALAKIKYAQSADVLFLVHPDYPPATLTRYSQTSWAYDVLDVQDGPFADPNIGDTTITPSAVTGTITLTASEDYFTSSMVGRTMKLVHTVPGQYQQGKPNDEKKDLSVSCVPGGTVYVESFGFWNGSFVVSKQDDAGTWVELKKQSGNRSQNYNMTFTNDDDVIRNYRVTSDEFNTSTREGEDANQRGYVTIQSFAKDYYGIARITAVSSATSASAEVVKRLGNTAATADFALDAWGSESGYPSAVGFFEDRLVFAGSKAQPQTYWASKSGDYCNFGVSVPQQDDDAITGTLTSGQMNGIKAIVSFGEMIMLTSGGEYRVSGGGDNFTPTNQQARAQEYRGISDIVPVIIGGRIVYVQRHGNIIRDLAYSYDVDKYTGDDVSLLAAHLFDNHVILSMTYQQIPNSVVWCVRSDGVLLGMTYVKEQDVYAWHRHETQGEFIDVCAISGANEDELWAVVYREGNWFIERMAKSDERFFVDSGYSRESEAATDTVTGLSWLAGKTVQICADGHVLPEMEVAANGTLTLDRAYKKIVVGLGYDTVIQTLPVEMAGQDGTWGSRKKRIQNMTVMFSDTVGGWFGFSEKSMDEIKWRSTEPYGVAIQPYSGKKRATLPLANYEDTLMLTIKQPDPLPMTILSIIPEVLPGG